MKEVTIERVKEWIVSPLAWVEDVFGLVPQPLKAGFVVGENTRLEDINVKWFEPFEKGKHLTWQQWVIFLGIERSFRGGTKFISVASGHGIGKSATMAILLLWFLICHENSQIPCTAPTAQQMFDVLWKEVSKWHAKLPEALKDKLEVESSYVRVKESPRTWFARAATARKESPEALAGIHAEDVMMLVDEAAGVPEEVFITGEGALTNKNALVLLISNYTRLTGYFHESQKNEYGEWCVLRFSSEDSPIVEQGYVEKMKRRGEGSNEYRVRVLGLPPNTADELKGYVPLVGKTDLRFTMMNELVQPIILGIDPSGEGRNRTALVLRDAFRAVPAGLYLNLKDGEVVQKALDLAEKHKIKPENIIIDSFGSGANVMQEFMALRKYAQGVLVGQPASDKTRFINLKAEMYWRLREWLIKGGELVGTAGEWEDMLNVMYTSEGSRVKIMSKTMMKSVGIKSYDLVEALMMTFYREEYEELDGEENEEVEEDWNPYDGL